jgi:Ni,Fe-hydrogenase maturation factor
MCAHVSPDSPEGATASSNLFMKQKKTIYIFGNPMLDFDNLPLKLASKLEKTFPEIDFVITDPSENLKPINDELIVIDTVEGIENVVLIDDIEKLETAKIHSLHDFDLAFNLKLLQKIGRLKSVKIFGVPMSGDEEKVLEQLEEYIKKFSLSSRA